MHHANSSFWKAYSALPQTARELADRNFVLLRDDPSHPSLHFKKSGKYWSARIGSSFRALAMEVPDGMLWFWIGAHDEYERIISKT